MDRCGTEGQIILSLSLSLSLSHRGLVGGERIGMHAEKGVPLSQRGQPHDVKSKKAGHLPGPSLSHCPGQGTQIGVNRRSASSVFALGCGGFGAPTIALGAIPVLGTGFPARVDLTGSQSGGAWEPRRGAVN